LSELDEIGSDGPWQIAATGLLASGIARQSTIAWRMRILSGVAAGNDQRRNHARRPAATSDVTIASPRLPGTARRRWDR
jgi:hypothetical protein